MFKYIFCFFVLQFILYFNCFAQIEQDSIVYVYDTVYMPADTVTEFIEVIEYEYIEVPEYSLSLQVGAGVDVLFGNFKTPQGEVKQIYAGYPLQMQFRKRFWQLRSGFGYYPVSCTEQQTQSVSHINERTKMLTVVVDTIYRENNGVPVEEIITKEVEYAYTDTTYTDSTTTNSYNYSSFKIPLLLGMSFEKNNFNFGFSTGIEFSFLSSDANTSLKKNVEVFNQFYTSCILQASLAYSISDHFVIETGVYGTYSITTDIPDNKNVALYLKLFYTVF